MMEPADFIGQQVIRPDGRIWQCKACNQPYVVVSLTSDAMCKVAYLRALCTGCLAECHTRHMKGLRTMQAKWSVLIAMTRSDRWPAWASKGVFDIE